MPAAYSYDLRERVVDTVEAGGSRRRAAGIFRVSVSTAVRWAKRVAETGSCAALPAGGDHKSRSIEAHKDWLLAQAKAEPDATLEEIRSRLNETHGLQKSVSCLWRFFDRHGVTFKKKRSSPLNRTGAVNRVSRPIEIMAASCMSLLSLVQESVQIRH